MAKHGDVFTHGAIELRCGDYRDVLADVTCDALITDPPYSERTHKGQRTGSSIRKTTIAYDAMTEIGAAALAARFSDTPWAVVFCDHLAFRWHEAVWAEGGRLVFAPLIVKENPPPRFSGDGPALALEFLCVSRTRSAHKPGSLPGYYQTTWGLSCNNRSPVAGSKPLGLMRDVVRDYSRPGSLVCDPFSGFATTLIAAAIEGRRAIGAELDPVTFEKACERIATSGEIERYAPSDALKHAKQVRLGL